MMLIEQKKAVVKIVNKLRKRAGLGSVSRLSRGVPSHSGPCALAMSLAGTGIRRVAAGTIGVASGGSREPDISIPTRTVMTEKEALVWAGFVNDFDAGLYPELEIVPR